MRPLYRATIPFAAAAVLAAAAVAAPAEPSGTPAPKPAALPMAFKAVAGPDAEALLLTDRYTLRDDGSIVREHTQRIQVNSSLAINRDFGESRIVFDPGTDAVTVLFNRTVLPSGEVVQGPANAIVDEQPPEAHGNPLWSHLRRKVIVHTALEPGAVIETAWTVVTLPSGPPSIAIAEPLTRELPVKTLRVELDVPAELPFFAPGGADGGASPECQESGGRRTCLWALDGVSALPNEAGTPPRSEVDAFAIAAAGAAAETGWACAELQRRWDTAGPAPAGAVAAARNAADAEPDRERRLLAALAALSDAVNVSARLSPSETAWRLHPLAEVWGAGWASPLEMAALDARVLSELGFKAMPALVLSGPQAGRAVGFALHERAAVLVRFAYGDDRLYDPREPAANRPLELALGEPHVIIPVAPTDLAFSGASTRRRLAARLAVEADGKLAGEMALEASGAATPHAALVRDPQKAATRLAGGLVDGAKASDVRVTRLARDAASLAASIAGALPERDAVGLVTLTLAGIAGGYGDELPPLPGSKRLSPVALPAPGQEVLDVTVTLPEGWTVAALPEDVKVDVPAGSLVVTAEKNDDGGTVTVHRTLTIAQRTVAAKDAATLRELLAACSSPASRDLILRPPKA